MINDLRYAVSFPTNGVSLSGQLSFQPGATAISGQNGTGKSFIAEMIRYGLFGKRALRGPASDYKTLDMALTFAAGGVSYDVRRGKKEELTSGDETLAVGADAVNKKITDLLGFGLEVFDVVCAANQKESERLTRLTPAKRKELIDDVVGLTAQEAVEKACREEAKTARVEAEALTRALVLPVEPVKPKGYRKSEKIREELNTAKETEATVAELRRIIAAVPPEPVRPSEPVGDVAALEAHEKARTETDARYKALYSSIERIPDPVYTAEQLNEVEAYHAHTAELAKFGPKPTIDIPSLVLKEMLDTWDEIDTLKRVGEVELHCPKCKRAFRPSHELPEQPEISRAEINTELQARARWAQAPAERPIPELALKLLPSDIRRGRLALDRAAEKQAMQAELDALPQLDIRVSQLDAARTRERLWAVYNSQLEHFAACAAEAGEAQYVLDHTPKLKHTANDLQEALTAARIYEERLVDYDIAKTKFDELSAEIAEKQERADAFMAGAKGLVEARRTLKAFLAPSLSRVASKVIREMTANSTRPLTDIVIDDEMNITADGQDVSTFNGAHATMINLALRLALGQVLVARVFPMFIGDEIDSDADEANAQAIADALMACKEQLKQIVLISHKRLEGVDHEVML